MLLFTYRKLQRSLQDVDPFRVSNLQVGSGILQQLQTDHTVQFPWSKWPFWRVNGRALYLIEIPPLPHPP